MNYRTEDNLSILGFGCMRFPQKGVSFDYDEIERELLYAIDKGVNYFDMAYIYNGIEEAFGLVMEKCGFRDKVNIATKLPHYMMKSVEDMQTHFDEQLRRLRTDHVDYYLMHMLPDLKTWKDLVDRGAARWLEGLKEAGKIRKIGFSFLPEALIYLGFYWTNPKDSDTISAEPNKEDETVMATKKTETKKTEEIKAVKETAEKAVVKAAEKKPAAKKPAAKPAAKKTAAKTAEKKPAAKAAEKKPAAKKAPAKKAVEVIIQSPMGGNITPDEILAKVGKADKIYVRVDENKAYWVRGKETGSVDLWD